MASKYFYPGYIGLVCLVCILMGTVYVTRLDFIYNEQRIGQLLLLMAGGLLVLFTPNRFIKQAADYLPASVLWGGVGVLLLGILSALFSPFPFYGGVELSLFLLLCVMAVITAYTVKEYEKAVWVVFAAATLFVLFYLLKFGLGYGFHLSGFKDFPLWPGSGFEYSITGFSNIRFFNQVQIFVLPLLIGSTVWATAKNRGLGWFLLLLSALWWMLLLRSAGRGITLSIFTAALIALILFKNHSHRWTRYFLGTLAAGFLLQWLLFDVIADPDQTKSVLRGGSGRLTLWPTVFMDSLGAPILGHGPMSFASIHTDYFRGHPHNSLLQLLYEFGYPVTLLLLAGIWHGIKQWVGQSANAFKTVADNADPDVIIRLSLTVSLIGGLLYSLFSGVIVMPASQLWLFLVAGTLLGYYYRQKNSGISNSVGYTFMYCCKVVILLACAGLITAVVRDVPHMERSKKAYTEQTSSKKLRPRLWQQGKIGLEYRKAEEKN